VTYNSESVLRGFMRSMLAQTSPAFVLYVIDNASQDRTLAELAKYQDPRIQLVFNRENKGVAAANNQGITAALHSGCDFVLLLNNDTEFEPRLLEVLVAEMESSQCDILAPKIMYYDAPQRLWFAGGHFSRSRAYATVHEGQGALDHGQFDVAHSIEYAPTCCMLIRKAVFERVGLMDEIYFVYFDDADFCFRSRQAGLKMWYSPNAVLLHKESSLTGGVHSDFALRFSARNKLYFLKKNLGPSWLLWAMIYQIYLIGRLLVGKDSLHAFNLRQRSYFAGLQLAARHKI